MEKKINIAEILKDCPKGMELDCTIYSNVTFIGINKEVFPTIKVQTEEGVMHLTECGCYAKCETAKCVIFPKGKTTWEGFVPPFKDGDIVTCGSGLHSYSWTCILKGTPEEIIDDYFIRYYCSLDSDGAFLPYDSAADSATWIRLATEAEKQKLFQAIKDNGYKWNAETKTLEKLVEPNFKVGDIVQYITDSTDRRKIKEIDTLHDMYYTNNYSIRFEDEDDWNLVSNNVEPLFKVGDKITEIGGSRKGEILYIDVDKYHVAVSNIIAIDVFFEDQDNWELANKFQINSLKPFEGKVLVRNEDNDEWRGQFFSHYDNNSDRPYVCIGVEGLCEYKQCIPFEGNEHLLGTVNDCDEYYKIWE